MAENNQIVTARGRIELRDYLRFSFSHSMHIWSFRLFVILSVLYSLLVWVITANGYWLSRIFLVTAGVMPVLTFVLIPLSIYLSVKRILTSNRLMQEEQRYGFSPSGLTTEASYGGSHLGWDKIYQVRGDRKAIYLYLSTMQAFVIPARYFDDGQAMKRAIEILRANLTPKQFKLNWKQ